MYVMYAFTQAPEEMKVSVSAFKGCFQKLPMSCYLYRALSNTQSVLDWGLRFQDAPQLQYTKFRTTHFTESLWGTHESER